MQAQQPHHIGIVVVAFVLVVDGCHLVVRVKVIHDGAPGRLDVARRAPAVGRHRATRDPLTARARVVARRHVHQHRAVGFGLAFVQRLTESNP